MKKVINLLFALLIIGIPSAAFADEATTTPDSATSTSPVLNIQASVDVPAGCTATDTDNVVHEYPQSDSLSSYLAICAFENALTNGSLSDVQLSNQYPSLGLFVTALNGVAADPNSQYWALYQNGNFANFGLTSLPVATGDIITLRLHDFADTDLGPQVTLTVSSLVSTSTASTSPAVEPPVDSATPPVTGGGGGNVIISHSQLNVHAALAYLASQQHADGSFDSSFLSDWAAFAFGATDSDAAKIKLHDYLASTSFAFPSVTDYERHAMALEALGINPYSGTATDYITPIVHAFDGIQIGDSSLDNDDIFAFFPLLHAGYSADDGIIKKTVMFILSAQNANGAWDGSADMTAAAIQALALVQSLPNVPSALTKAEEYLHTQQQSSGGFGNSFSTSWAMQAFSALNGSTTSSSPVKYAPQDYLASLQQSDGGIEPVSSSVQTRIWATAYAIPAVLGKTWSSLLQSFPKPLPKPEISIGATSTPPVPVATSTPVQKKVVARIKTPAASSLPILVDVQTAAVANASASRNLFASLWNFIASFFTNIL